MYVPWQPLDVIKQGRIRWNRRKMLQARTGLFFNQAYWVVEPAHAPFVTGFGVLVSKVNYKYSGMTPGLWTIYNNMTHDLSRILAKYDIKENSFWKAVASNPFWRGYWGYRVANDIFNKVVGRYNRVIVSASTRLSESDLSHTERRNINGMIRRSNSMICFYDFRKDILYKP